MILATDTFTSNFESEPKSCANMCTCGKHINITKKRILEIIPTRTTAPPSLVLKIA
ncbi:DUF1922 domain-containing protein [Candidatus Babeliales bacterium]|nr:DUF1922 domain-containing protein [Candidatus Babeliales bacterium]